jgi:hypothetical protein
LRLYMKQHSRIGRGWLRLCHTQVGETIFPEIDVSETVYRIEMMVGPLY